MDRAGKMEAIDCSERTYEEIIEFQQAASNRKVNSKKGHNRHIKEGVNRYD